MNTHEQYYYQIDTKHSKQKKKKLRRKREQPTTSTTPTPLRLRCQSTLLPANKRIPSMRRVRIRQKPEFNVNPKVLAPLRMSPPLRRRMRLSSRRKSSRPSSLRARLSSRIRWWHQACPREFCWDPRWVDPDPHACQAYIDEGVCRCLDLGLLAAGTHAAYTTCLAGGDCSCRVFKVRSSWLLNVALSIAFNDGLLTLA